MKEINTGNWQEFQIGKLFQVSRGRRFVVGKHKEGNIPYYSASLENNGITDYISNPLFIDKNAIIVTTFCDAFYAKGEFTASDEITILHHEKMNEINGLFIVSAIKKNAWKYSFKVKAFQTRIIEDTIKLPINKKGEPDWEYMESYMKNIMQESEQNISKLKSIDTNKNKIDINNWKKFHLYDKDLFIIDMGTKLDKSKMTVDNPSVNFVGRANTNNGITVSVDKIFGLKPYQAGNMTLSLGGEYLGSCFVQPKEFYTSQNVVVLIPQWDMPNEVKNFISTMIFKESRTHYKAFVDELNRHIKTDFSFYLPVVLNNKPDWEYMENYMKNIMQDTQSKLDKLVCC